MRRIVIFNFSDQGTSRQTENFRNYITEMSGKGSSTLNCDICNTKFGFLTRKVKKIIRHLIYIFQIIWFRMSSRRHIFMSIFRNHARSANCISARVASNPWHLKRYPIPDTIMEVRDYWKSVQGITNFIHTHYLILKFLNQD